MINTLVYTILEEAMYMNRQISINDSINARLKAEPNASALINTLLNEHYNGTDEAHKEVHRLQEKLRNQLLRIVQLHEKYVNSNNRLASAVEDMAVAIREQGRSL